MTTMTIQELHAECDRLTAEIARVEADTARLEAGTKAQKRAERAEKKARRALADAQVLRAQLNTRAVVSSGKCPDCGRKLRQNLAITGWWQCSQFGAEGFRADASLPSCSWQGFTH